MHRQSGLSLLELLVVMVLIAAMAGLLSLSSGSGAGRLGWEHAQGLAQRLQANRQNAVLEGREYGVRIAPDGYTLMRLDDTQWVTVEPFTSAPQGWTWSLQQAGLAVNLERSPHTAQILLLSSDELTPFELVLESAGQRLRLASDGVGEPVLDEG